MSLVMGIDGGGTRTVAVVLDESLRELGRGEAGPANYHSVGLSAAISALRLAAEAACREAGCLWTDLRALGCGMAGAGRPADQVMLRRALAESLPVARLALTHDAEIALVGGTGRREGVVVISGTGSMAYGVNGAGGSVRAGGWGPILDDAGSGFWIGQCALRSALRGLEGRGPSTVLTEEVLDALALSRLEDLVDWASAKEHVRAVAALAPRVGVCARAGDEVAGGILRRAGCELAGLVEAVLCRPEMEDSSCQVVLSGGVLQNQPLVVEALRGRLARSFPQATPMWPLHEPVVGAGLLGLIELEEHERDPD